jgi:hypothetical protein
LHPWPLLGQHELATGEILLRFREQDRHLQRKNVLAVQILMQRIEVPGAILQQERRRPRLPRLVASPNELGESVGKPHIDAHRLVPAIGDRCQPRIQRRAKRGDGVGQRVREVLVFTTPEAVGRHDDTAPEPAIVLVEAGDALALIGGQERLQHCPAAAVEMRRNARPIDRIDTRVDVDRADLPCCERRVHVTSSDSVIGVDRAPS